MTQTSRPAPGFQIRNAARYQSRLTLADRIQIFDADRWRSAGVDELAALCSDEGEVSVIGIPRHLLKRWWNLAESNEIVTGFAGYAREIAEYFNYKSWDLPPEAVMEVAVSDGGATAPQPSRTTCFSAGPGALLACVNLDDDNTAIALGPEFGRIRIILEPGEGLMLPSTGIHWSRSALISPELTVMLMIGVLSSQ